MTASRPPRIVLELSSRVLAPGDALRGRVTLALEAPFDGQRLSVVLSAVRRAVARTPGSLALSYTKTIAWQRETELDSERVYRDGASYPFEVVVPVDVLDGAREDEWTATALLTHPWKAPLKQVVKVRVVARPQRASRKTSRRRTSSPPE